MLQSPFMNRIGSTERVREELVAALAEGRGVTAKVRWVSRPEDEGRNRWIHCTPLLGHNGSVGVWMVVLVDDDTSRTQRRFRQAPPVASVIKSQGDSTRQRRSDDEWASLGSGERKYGRATSPPVSVRNDFEFRLR